MVTAKAAQTPDRLPPADTGRMLAAARAATYDAAAKRSNGAESTGSGTGSPSGPRRRLVPRDAVIRLSTSW
jgi:hypothetical protein